MFVLVLVKGDYAHKDDGGGGGGDDFDDDYDYDDDDADGDDNDKHDADEMFGEQKINSKTAAKRQPKDAPCQRKHRARAPAHHDDERTAQAARAVNNKQP